MMTCWRWHWLQLEVESRGDFRSHLPIIMTENLHLYNRGLHSCSEGTVECFEEFLPCPELGCG